jgi:adenylosuccinate lyase
MARDDAYRIVQEAAQRAFDEGVPLRDLIAEAGGPAAELDLDELFDFGWYVRYADEVIERLAEVG